MKSQNKGDCEPKFFQCIFLLPVICYDRKPCVIEDKEGTKNISNSNDKDIVRKPDDSTLCVIEASNLIQNIFHGNDNDSATNPDASNLCVIDSNN